MPDSAGHDAAQRCADAADAAALDAFNSDPSQMVTDDVRAVVAQVAATGCVRHEWRRVKPVLLALLRHALDTFPEPPPAEPQPQPNTPQIAPAPGDAAQQPPAAQQRHAAAPCPAVDVEWYITALDSFTVGPPFTIQRLCEVLLSPTQHYSRKHKVAHSLEKLLLVTSIIPAGPAAAVVADRVAASRAAAAAAAAIAASAAAAAAAATSAAAAAATAAAAAAGDVAMAPQEDGVPHNAPGELFASARDAGAETAAAMEVDGGVTGGEAATAADAAQSPGGRPKAPCSPGAAHVGGMHANGPAAQAVTVGTAARC